MGRILPNRVFATPVFRVSTRIFSRYSFTPRYRVKYALMNCAAQLATNGNILQIRITRTEPPRGCAGLRKAGVQAPRFRMDELRQRVHIRRFELGDFTVLDDFRGKRMLRR